MTEKLGKKILWNERKFEATSSNTSLSRLEISAISLFIGIEHLGWIKEAKWGRKRSGRWRRTSCRGEIRLLCNGCGFHAVCSGVQGERAEIQPPKLLRFPGYIKTALKITLCLSAFGNSLCKDSSAWFRRFAAVIRPVVWQCQRSPSRLSDD